MKYGYYDFQVTERPTGKRLAIDEQAESADHGFPGIPGPVTGSTYYHGFSVIDGAEADGFRLA